MSDKAGFSLIEAMTALIIASLVLLAAYGLQQQITLSEVRYERALSLAERKKTAIVLVRDINPAAEPTGARAMAGKRRLTWRATPKGQFKPVTGGRWEARLYTVDVTLLEADGRPAATLRFDRVGWRPLSAARPGSPDRSASPAG